MNLSLEECRLAMIIVGLAAIPVALLIEWVLPSSTERQRVRRPTPTPLANRPPPAKTRTLRATTLHDFRGHPSK